MKKYFIIILVLCAESLFSQNTKISNFNKIPYTPRVSAVEQDRGINMIFDYPYEGKLTLLKIDANRSVGRSKDVMYDSTMKYWLYDKYFIILLYNRLSIFEFDTILNGNLRTIQDTETIPKFNNKPAYSDVSYVAVDEKKGVFFTVKDEIRRIDFSRKSDFPMAKLNSNGAFMQFTATTEVGKASKPSGLSSREEKAENIENKLLALNYSGKKSVDNDWQSFIGDNNLESFNSSVLENSHKKILENTKKEIDTYYLDLALIGREPDYYSLKTKDKKAYENNFLFSGNGPDDNYKKAKKDYESFFDTIDKNIKGYTKFDVMVDDIFLNFNDPKRITQAEFRRNQYYSDFEKYYCDIKNEEYEKKIQEYIDNEFRDENMFVINNKPFTISGYIELKRAYTEYLSGLAEYKDIDKKELDRLNVDRVKQFKNERIGIRKNDNSGIINDTINKKYDYLELLSQLFKELAEIPNKYTAISPDDKRAIEKYQLEQLKKLCEFMIETQNEINNEFRSRYLASHKNFITKYDKIIDMRKNTFPGFVKISGDDIKIDNFKTNDSLFKDVMQILVQKQIALIEAEKKYRLAIYYNLMNRVNDDLKELFSEQNPYNENEKQNDFMYYYKAYQDGGEKYRIGLSGLEQSLLDNSRFGGTTGNFGSYLNSKPISVFDLTDFYSLNTLHKLFDLAYTPFVKKDNVYLCIIENVLLRFSYECIENKWQWKISKEGNFLTMIKSMNDKIYALKDASFGENNLTGKSFYLVELKMSSEGVKEEALSRDSYKIENGSYITIVSMPDNSDRVFISTANGGVRLLPGNGSSGSKTSQLVPVSIKSKDGTKQYFKLAISSDGSYFTDSSTIENNTNFVRFVQ